MEQARFLARVGSRTGIEDEAVVEAIARATLSALGCVVGHSHRQSVAEHLPEGLARVFREAKYDASVGRDVFVARVAAASDAPHAMAIEGAQTVLQTVAGELDAPGRTVLERELPEDMRAWLEPPEERPPPPRAPAHPAKPVSGARISEAHPGSAHPLSEAAPRGHADSVAASDDPHADTRLSSARGLTQEREHETLAEGAAEPDHPIDETSASSRRISGRRISG